MLNFYWLCFPMIENISFVKPGALVSWWPSGTSATKALRLKESPSYKLFDYILLKTIFLHFLF